MLVPSASSHANASERVDLVSGGEYLAGEGWPLRPRITDIVTVTGKSAHLWSGRAADASKFHMYAKLELPVKSGTGAAVRIGSSLFGFDGAGGRCYSEGPFFLGSTDFVDASEKAVREGVPFELEITRDGKWLEVKVNGERMYNSQIDDAPLGRIGLTSGTGELRVLDWWMEGDFTTWLPPESLFTVTDDRIDEYTDPVLVTGAGGALHAFVTGVSTLDDGRDAFEVFERVRDAAGAWSEPRPVATRGVARIAAWSGSNGPIMVGVRKADDGAARGILLERSASGWIEQPLAIEGLDDAKVGELLVTRLQSRAGSLLDGRRTVALASASDAANKLGVMTLTEGDAGKPWRVAPLEPFERIAFLGTPAAEVALGVRGNAIAALRRTAGAWGAEIPWPLAWNPSVNSSLVAEQGRAELFSGTLRRETGLKRAVLEAGAGAWRDAPNDLWPAQVGAVSAARLADGRSAVLFEGGERARREHVLFGVLDAPKPQEKAPAADDAAGASRGS
ncbi:MAG: hypothetical protein ACO3QC_05435 [Phycisphaerales bacterium]